VDEPQDPEPLEAFYGGEVELFELRPRAQPLRPVPPRRSRTATGAILAGIALGLRDVFDPERKDTIAIEEEAPAGPAGPQRYEIKLNGSPRHSQAIFRPWVDPEDS